jgi:hypothetical protein
MFGERLPNAKDQSSGTAFAAALTLSLIPKNAHTPVLYGTPRETARRILEKHGIVIKPEERFVDFLVEDEASETRPGYLVACESEMYADHGCGTSFECEWYGGKWCRSNGYAWDFCKLLHFPAPYLLFVARTSESKFARLEASLSQRAKEYRDLWDKRRLAVILLPTARQGRHGIRLGEGQADGAILFSRVEDACQGRIAEKHSRSVGP